MFATESLRTALTSSGYVCSNLKWRHPPHATLRFRARASTAFTQQLWYFETVYQYIARVLYSEMRVQHIQQRSLIAVFALAVVGLGNRGEAQRVSNGYVFPGTNVTAGSIRWAIFYDKCRSDRHKNCRDSHMLVDHGMSLCTYRLLGSLVCWSVTVCDVDDLFVFVYWQEQRILHVSWRWKKLGRFWMHRCCRV